MDKPLEVNVSDSISITDSVSYSTHLSPEMYREEFERYRSLIASDDGGKGYTLAYIMLQLYIENHTHYFLRFLIGDGFSKNAVVCWNPKDYIEQKLDCFRSVLDQSAIFYTPTLFDDIKTNYRYLCDVRNLLAHGHPITASYDNGTTTISDAKAYLEPQRFADITNRANVVINAWNTLMDEVGQQETLVRSAGLPSKSFFNDCKYNSIL